MGATRVDDRTSAWVGIERYAAVGREFDHRAGCGGRLAETGGQVRTEEVEGRFGGGDSNGAGRLPGTGVGRGVLGGGSGVFAERRGGHEPLFAWGSCSARGRRVQESGAGRIAHGDCGAWQGRVL